MTLYAQSLIASKTAGPRPAGGWRPPWPRSRHPRPGRAASAWWWWAAAGWGPRYSTRCKYQDNVSVCLWIQPQYSLYLDLGESFILKCTNVSRKRLHLICRCTFSVKIWRFLQSKNIFWSQKYFQKFRTLHTWGGWSLTCRGSRSCRSPCPCRAGGSRRAAAAAGRSSPAGSSRRRYNTPCWDLQHTARQTRVSRQSLARLFIMPFTNMLKSFSLTLIDDEILIQIKHV